MKVFLGPAAHKHTYHFVNDIGDTQHLYTHCIFGPPYDMPQLDLRVFVCMFDTPFLDYCTQTLRL